MGRSVLTFIGKGNQQTMQRMLTAICAANEEGGNDCGGVGAHLTASVEAKVLELGIVLVNLPPYSPELNLIERIWKQVKKAIGKHALVRTIEELENVIQTTFVTCYSKLSFAKSWIENIYNHVFEKYPIAISDKL